MRIVAFIDSPAARAGIQSGDFIYAVDGVTVTAKSMDTVLSKMRGAPGSDLKLELIPATEIKRNKDGSFRSAV